MSYRSFALWVVVLSLFLPQNLLALESDEILVIANKNAARSVGLARYYMDKREVPENKLLQIWVTDGESCSRQEYDKKIASPVREFFKNYEGEKTIRCLLLFYGVPLKVAGPGDRQEEKGAMSRLKARRRELKKSIADSEKTEREVLEKELAAVRKALKKEKLRRNRSSSVDSELALILAEEYPLSMWIKNPYFIGYRGKKLALSKDEVLMVSRLDGPDSDTVKRLIDDSLEIEKKGLDGTAYFDARWPEPKKRKRSGYAFYDQSIHRAARKVEDSGRLPVTKNEKGALFQPGDCPDAALYCGWYRLAHYVDAFEWVKGAVGYHIASQECQTLRRKNSRVWCKRMLEEGVSATLGPVEEPFLQSFPVPEIFFAYLLDGDFSLAECYLLANPFWSWKMVLVGDPLYRPFAVRNSSNEKTGH